MNVNKSDPTSTQERILDDTQFDPTSDHPKNDDPSAPNIRQFPVRPHHPSKQPNSFVESHDQKEDQARSHINAINQMLEAPPSQTRKARSQYVWSDAHHHHSSTPGNKEGGHDPHHNHNNHHTPHHLRQRQGPRTPRPTATLFGGTVHRTPTPSQIHQITQRITVDSPFVMEAAGHSKERIYADLKLTPDLLNHPGSLVHAAEQETMKQQEILEGHQEEIEIEHGRGQAPPPIDDNLLIVQHTLTLGHQQEKNQIKLEKKAIGHEQEAQPPVEEPRISVHDLVLIIPSPLHAAAPQKPSPGREPTHITHVELAAQEKGQACPHSGLIGVEISELRVIDSHHTDTPRPLLRVLHDCVLHSSGGPLPEGYEKHLSPSLARQLSTQIPLSSAQVDQNVDHFSSNDNCLLDDDPSVDFIDSVEPLTHPFGFSVLPRPDKFCEQTELFPERQVRPVPYPILPPHTLPQPPSFNSNPVSCNTKCESTSCSTHQPHFKQYFQSPARPCGSSIALIGLAGSSLTAVGHIGSDLVPARKNVGTDIQHHESTPLQSEILSRKATPPAPVPLDSLQHLELNLPLEEGPPDSAHLPTLQPDFDAHFAALALSNSNCWSSAPPTRQARYAAGIFSPSRQPSQLTNPILSALMTGKSIPNPPASEMYNHPSKIEKPTEASQTATSSSPRIDDYEDLI